VLKFSWAAAGGMTMLFEPPFTFAGLPREGFEAFGLPDRVERRRAIIRTIHPELSKLGQDLLTHYSDRTARPLHFHLPRLDWPQGYQPFCTWLALSHKAQGYQAGPQLNLGVHADFVSIRLGWDTTATAFDKFEFLSRHGALAGMLAERAQLADLSFMAYASATWPEGSRLVYRSPTDIGGAFDEVRRRGVWWELGRRYEIPESLDLVCSAEFGTTVSRIFDALLPLFERIEGDDNLK
jgi:hypothetical protein